MWRPGIVLVLVGCASNAPPDVASFAAQLREASCAYYTRCGVFR